MGADSKIEKFRVVQKNGWSYVVGERTIPEHSGPWRYEWEAQIYADELNGQAASAPPVSAGG